jgi:hypothetical protein
MVSLMRSSLSKGKMMEAHWPDGKEHSDSALGSLPEELCKQILGRLEHSDLASLAQGEYDCLHWPSSNNALYLILLQRDRRALSSH